MSTPQPASSAKLVISMLAAGRPEMAPVGAALEAQFGPLDLTSAPMAFDYTTYYEREMGPGLSRRVLVFRRLIPQERLPEIKLATNALEQSWAVGARRRINLDPGYLLLERFVLASGKNFSHRIYLGQGIYADLTLIYRGGEFHPLPWTYPDYADAPLRYFLGKVRRKYALDVKMGCPPGDGPR